MNDKTVLLNKMLDKDIPKLINTNKRINDIMTLLNKLKQQEMDTQKMLIMSVIPALDKCVEDINDINNRLTALENASGLQPLENANGLQPLENTNGLQQEPVN